ncbi:hypothetical protein G4B88_010235 [Cannabis sativa]|uniref:Uncharacterized protein n=1 Tax=Cannabis sativa TaxID=3483 RepID=A0A7J6I5I3_CANSA|nr:hypothetical protein G4B88_010235 [Cannabis sativa]
MGVTPLVSMRRDKRVVSDYPWGTGPLGRVENNLGDHASNESTEEPLESDEIVSKGCTKIGVSPSFKGIEPVSVGQSVRLTTWKMKARLMDLSIPCMFLEPLELCYRSLCSCGDRPIADGSLLDFMRQLSTFGLSLVRLDIRQESDRHTDVMDAITKHLDIGLK